MILELLAAAFVADVLSGNNDSKKKSKKRYRDDKPFGRRSHYERNQYYDEP